MKTDVTAQRHALQPECPPDRSSHPSVIDYITYQQFIFSFGAKTRVLTPVLASTVYWKYKATFHKITQCEYTDEHAALKQQTTAHLLLERRESIQLILYGRCYLYLTSLHIATDLTHRQDGQPTRITENCTAQKLYEISNITTLRLPLLLSVYV